MATKSTVMSLSDLLTNSTVMSDNIKLNGDKIGRYGIDVSEFTDEMNADIRLATEINQEQERLKSQLKMKTEELNQVQLKLEKNYGLAKKTVKLAEPQVNWVGYGIADKK
ncbi:MAG: hypothetical protein QM800_14065 [Paludibacter sp.]